MGTLSKNGHLGSLSLLWSSLPLQAWSCTWYLCHCPLVSCWLWKASLCLLIGSYPSVLGSVTAVKRQVASVPIWVTSVNQFVPTLDAWDWGIPMLTSFSLLLFSLKADPIRLSFPSLHQCNSCQGRSVSKSNGQFSAIILLDFLVTFDIVDHFFLLEVLSSFTLQDDTFLVAPS